MNHFKAKAIEVIAGIIVEHSRVLICQRSATSQFPLKWEFPGGKVETGENHSDALRRELREELAIEVEESKEIERYMHHYRDMPPVALRFYKIVKYQGKINNLIFQQVVWAPVPNLARFDFLEGDLPLIKKLMSPNAGGLAL